MFCVECGSEEKLYGPLCKKCLLSKGLMTPPEYVSVHVCPSCMKVLDGPTWREMPHEDVAASLLEKATRIHTQVKHLRWDVPNFPPEKGEHRVACTAFASIAGEELAQDYEVGIRIRYEKCQSCSRQSGDYYEAIIQLRIEGLGIKEVEVELAEENALVLKMVDENSDENAFITKYSPVKGGMDYYIGSAALARTIANKFRNRYGASINEAPSLVGMKDGNDLYRYSILIRLPSYREGDIVALDRKLHVVEASDGKAMVLKAVSNGKIVRVNPGDQRLKAVARYRELRDAVVVSQEKHVIQILDPDSMATVTVTRPPYIKRVGETVHVVRYDDALYMV